jgi:hypothetical protein
MWTPLAWTFFGHANRRISIRGPLTGYYNEPLARRGLHMTRAPELQIKRLSDAKELMYCFRRPIASILVLLSVREEIGGGGIYENLCLIVDYINPRDTSLVVFGVRRGWNQIDTGNQSSLKSI